MSSLDSNDLDSSVSGASVKSLRLAAKKLETLPWDVDKPKIAPEINVRKMDINVNTPHARSISELLSVSK